MAIVGFVISRPGGELLDLRDQDQDQNKSGMEEEQQKPEQRSNKVPRRAAAGSASDSSGVQVSVRTQQAH